MKAFPTGTRVSPDSYDTGMDLRDYFAAKVISGMMAHGESYNINAMAEYSYQMADAMIEARKSRQL